MSRIGQINQLDHSEAKPQPNRAKRLECGELAPALDDLPPSTAGTSSCGLHAFPIPKGLRPPAQGCEERANLGDGPKRPPTLKGLLRCFAGFRMLRSWRHNPVRVEFTWPSRTQGSSFLTTLGFEPESLWDS